MDDDIFAVPGAAPAPKPTQKRSFFSKSKAAKVEKANSQEDATDFFRNSSTVFSSIIHEQELKKKEKLVKRFRAKAKRDDSVDEDIDAPAKSRKKRRISEEADESDMERKSSVEVGAPWRATRSQTNTPTKDLASPRGKARRVDSLASPRKPKATDVVDLDDSTSEAENGDDDDLYAPPKSKHTPTKPRKATEIVELQDETQDPDDDVDPELAAKARERRRQKELEVLKQGLAYTGSAALHTPPKPAPDPPMSLFLDSNIEGMKPLLIRIYLSKKIEEVHKTYCDFNNLDERQRANIFLTWRRLKQWGTTTLKRMLEGVVDFEVQDDGTIVSRPGSKGDGLSGDLSRIHLRATTDEGHDEMRREYQRSMHAPSPELSPEDDLGGALHDDLSNAVAPPKNNDLKIILICNDKQYGELKIKVKPDTSIARLISAYKASKKVPSDKLVSLRFDGDELDPVNRMEDTEIEDDDKIEVYIRDS